MRVLFIVKAFPPDQVGGAEVSAYHTCRELDKRGVTCSVLVVNNRLAAACDEWGGLDGLPVHRVSFYTGRRRPAMDVFDRRVYRAVCAELRQLKPNLVHIHNVSGATLAPYLACRALGVPVVNTLHDLWLLCPNNMLYRRDGSFCNPERSPRGCRDCYRRYDFWGDVPFRRAVFSALTSNVDVFISPSQAVIDRHVEAGYAPHRFRLVRLGFEGRVSEGPSLPGVRAVADGSFRHRTVVFAGGGLEIKGAGVLLEALPMILRCVERLKVVVAGAEDEKFLSRFRRYAPSVSVLGWVPFTEMGVLFAVSDLTILPSIWHENSPVIIYESFQVGTPVVGSAIGGIPELIRDGETGYLFPVGDAAALAERVILHFARLAYERRRMRQRCVEGVRTGLTLERHIEGTLKVYREVLGD